MALLDDSKKELVIQTSADATGIRYSIGTGISGQVALNGEMENIHDVYHDERFNKAIDLQMKCRTKQMLCAPIFDMDNNVLGVVTAMNQVDDIPSSLDDERMMKYICSNAGQTLLKAKECSLKELTFCL